MHNVERVPFPLRQSCGRLFCKNRSTPCLSTLCTGGPGGPGVLKTSWSTRRLRLVATTIPVPGTVGVYFASTGGDVRALSASHGRQWERRCRFGGSPLAEKLRASSSEHRVSAAACGPFVLQTPHPLGERINQNIWWVHLLPEAISAAFLSDSRSPVVDRPILSGSRSPVVHFPTSAFSVGPAPSHGAAHDRDGVGCYPEDVRRGEDVSEGPAIHWKDAGPPSGAGGRSGHQADPRRDGWNVFPRGAKPGPGGAKPDSGLPAPDSRLGAPDSGLQTPQRLPQEYVAQPK